MPDRSLVETLDLLLASVGTVVALALVFLVPGLTLGRLLAPGAQPPLLALARAAGASLLTASATCTVLAKVGLLQPLPIVVSLGALTLVPLLVARPRPWRFGGRARGGWSLAAAAAVVVALVLVVPSALEVRPTGLPWTSTVWYYGGLSDAIAATGAVPSTFPEWGGERPFHTDYLPFSTHAAAAFALLPGDLAARMEAYRLGLLVVATLLAALLLRRFVSSWLAVLGAILLLATERLAFKLLAFKPETFGLAVALFTLWALDRALVERRPRLVALAVAGATLTFLAHAEVFLVLAALAAPLALARLLVAPSPGGSRVGRRAIVGLRVPGLRRSAATIALLVAVVGGGGVLGILGNGLIAGELRLLGYVTGDRGGTVAGTDGPAEPPPIAPPGWTFTGDPTWDFYVAAVAPGQLGRAAPDSFLDRRLLPRAILHVWPGLDARAGSVLVVLGGLLALPLLAWPWLDARRRRLVLLGYGFGVCLAVGSWLLFSISDTYVPRRVGPRRLMPYELVVPVVAALLVLWALARLLRPGWHALLGGRAGAGAGARRAGRPRVAAGVFLALVAAAMVAPAPAPAPGEEDVEGRLTSAGAEAWAWIAANAPPGARVLTNAYTDGVVAAFGRRTGIVDGRAVYLEDPAFLAESTALLLGARALFADPGGSAAAAYLADTRADLLLVADERVGATGSDLGGYRPFVTDVAALDESGRYTLVRTFGDGRLRLYRPATTIAGATGAARAGAGSAS